MRTLSNQTPTANNGTTHYVWDIFGRIIAEANGSTGATLRETIYMPTGAGESMPIAAVNAAVTPKLTYAVHVDHLNRPIMMTDAAKANVWWASYEPFGRVRATGGALTQNLGLPGQWFQLENGLAYNWHRHYDPTTGRYATPDPLGFVDGPSVFAYAGGMPQISVDPTGLNRSTPRPPRVGPVPATPISPGQPYIPAPPGHRYVPSLQPLGTPIPPPAITPTTQSCTPIAPQGGVYGLYRGNQLCYVGQTCDLVRREREHGRDARFRGLEFRPLYRTNEYGTRRGLEDMIFSSSSSGLMNMNRPISPTNPNGPAYRSAADSFLAR